MGVNERVVASALGFVLSLAAAVLGIMLVGKISYSFGHKALLDTVFIAQLAATCWLLRAAWSKQ